MIFENADNYCFLWSFFSTPSPLENSHPNRVSNYREYFNELKLDGLDFSDGFKISFVSKIEKMNTLAIKIFELQFYQEGINWKQKLIPVEVSGKISETVIDLMIYKNHNAFIKKLHVFMERKIQNLFVVDV